VSAAFGKIVASLAQEENANSSLALAAVTVPCITNTAVSALNPKSPSSCALHGYPRAQKTTDEITIVEPATV
jgi:hypothetical protein